MRRTNSITANTKAALIGVALGKEGGQGGEEIRMQLKQKHILDSKKETEIVVA